MSTKPQRTFLGHPLGLYVLFFTEMWERFSYYGMRALLLLYMVNYFKWSQKDASTVYKVYTSFVYVTPILGGFLADRLLGNRMAVIIGAILMAIGHFLMAFERTEIFYMALIFLIFGNGFFKPNMSTQVGRLYPPNDGRRDGAYTIFYMGINLGAFIAPLLCGWLQENTIGGYHSGFTMAGIGMVLGLIIYLVGQPLIMELPPDAAPVVATSSSDAATDSPAPKRAVALSEAEAEKAPSSLGFISAMSPVLLPLLGLVSLAAGVYTYWSGRLSIWDSIMAGIGGACLILVGYVCSNVKGGVRDRVLTILALGVFVVFFWGAFEQAGNVLNLWADKSTNRFLSIEPPEPALYPEVPPVAADEEEKNDAAGTIFTRLTQMFQLKPTKDAAANDWSTWFSKSVNPVPTTWFQAVNALAIFTIAPLFAWMWVVLDRKGMQPSIPMKMTIGLLLVSASVAVMIAGATQEHKPSSQVLTTGELPAGITVKDGLVGFMQTTGEGDQKTEHFEPFHAGRLRYNEATKTLEMMGVLPDNERDRIIEKSAPADYAESVSELEKLFKPAEVKPGAEKGPKVETASVSLTPPPGFDLKFAGLPEKDVFFKDGKLTANKELAERDVKGLLVSGGSPEFRSDIHALYAKSAKFRVTPLWLIYSYILATLGELCLSPVGLSMVSKLAPTKYATMLMGVWMLTSSFGNFAAGLAGEQWGLVPPVTFFTVLAIAVAIAATVLFTLVNWLVKAMHGVN